MRASGRQDLSVGWQELLGLADDTAWIDVPPIFPSENLVVHIADRLSTRFPHQAKSMKALTELMAAQFEAQPGNYLAFFSSFEYAQESANPLATRRPDIAQWRQSKSIDGTARTEFLDRFVTRGSGIGFKVLGWIFVECVDLPGSKFWSRRWRSCCVACCSWPMCRGPRPASNPRPCTRPWPGGWRLARRWSASGRWPRRCPGAAPPAPLAVARRGGHAAGVDAAGGIGSPGSAVRAEQPSGTPLPDRLRRCQTSLLGRRCGQLSCQAPFSGITYTMPRLWPSSRWTTLS